MIDRDLRPLAPDRRLLVASGGGAVNAPAWLAMIASALATSVVLTDEPEATSRGAAVLALERLCPASPLPEPAFGQPFEPDAARHAVYNHAVERQQSLYAALAGWHSARE